MKKTLVIIAAVCIATACKKSVKDYKDYYPIVKTTSAELQADGSVVVTGELVSEGAGQKIKYIGFCADTTETPALNANQMVVTSIDDNKFTATYTKLEEDRNYYFKTWAANDYGYTISDNYIRVQNLQITPPLVPCTLPQDSLIIVRPSGNKTVEKYYTIGTIERHAGNEWSISMSSDSRRIEYLFMQKPTSGVYKTTDYDSFSGARVKLTIDGITADTGSSIYITKLDASRVQIAICDATYWDGIPYTIRTKVNTQ